MDFYLIIPRTNCFMCFFLKNYYTLDLHCFNPATWIAYNNKHDLIWHWLHCQWLIPASRFFCTLQVIRIRWKLIRKANFVHANVNTWKFVIRSIMHSLYAQLMYCNTTRNAVLIIRCMLLREKKQFSGSLATEKHLFDRNQLRQTFNYYM